jgi:hypothetical protein
MPKDASELNPQDIYGGAHDPMKDQVKPHHDPQRG